MKEEENEIMINKKDISFTEEIINTQADGRIKYMVGQLNIKKKTKFIVRDNTDWDTIKMVKDYLLDSFNENIYGSTRKQLRIIRSHLYDILIGQPTGSYHVNDVCIKVEKLLSELEW